MWQQERERPRRSCATNLTNERVGNTEKILVLSLRTIRDANIDILHHTDKESLDGISAPFLFLQDKDPARSQKKWATHREGSRLAEVPDATEEEARPRERMCGSIGFKLSGSQGLMRWKRCCRGSRPPTALCVRDEE